MSCDLQGSGGGDGGGVPGLVTIGTFASMAVAIAADAAASPVVFGCIVPLSSPWIDSESVSVLIIRPVTNMCGRGFGNPMQ